MADTRLKEKAVATAFEYQQGNIAGLDDATTRRLVASVVLHKSRGGDLEIDHPAGFVGRYQAGATWLAAASYVDQDKLKDSMSEHRTEWAWAKSGGMTQFLEDASNWKNGLTLGNYRQSAALQDGAFKINADGSYQRAVKQGVLGDDDNPLRVAGFLKVEQMVGYGAAVAAVTGGRALRDARGVSNYDYLHDITRNRDGLNELMSHAIGSLKKGGQHFCFPMPGIPITHFTDKRSKGLKNCRRIYSETNKSAGTPQPVWHAKPKPAASSI